MSSPCEKHIFYKLLPFIYLGFCYKQISNQSLSTGHLLAWSDLPQIRSVDKHFGLICAVDHLNA